MFPDNPFLQHHGTDWRTVSLKPVKVASGTIREAILEVATRRRGGFISDDLREAMPDFNWQSVRNSVKRMISRGELERTGATRKGANCVRQYVMRKT